jgi:hypothetical protein
LYYLYVYFLTLYKYVRLLTLQLGTAAANMFYKSKPGTLHYKVFKSNMNGDSFTGPLIGIERVLKETNSHAYIGFKDRIMQQTDNMCKVFYSSCIPYMGARFFSAISHWTETENKRSLSGFGKSNF